MTVARGTAPGASSEATSATLGDLADQARPVVGLIRDLPAGYRGPWHRHGRALLIYAQRGVLTLSAREGAWTVPPARAIWVPGGRFCSLGAPAPARACTLHIDPGRVRNAVGECQVVEVGELAKSLILRLGALPSDLQTRSRARRLVDVLVDEMGDLEPSPLHVPIPVDPRVVAVTDALRANPADGRTLAEFAAEFAASERNLARLFLKDTGLSFGQWRTRLRLLAAVSRLGEGASVTEVGALLGYKSASAFVAMFRRTLGTPPWQFMHPDS